MKNFIRILLPCVCTFTAGAAGGFVIKRKIMEPDRQLVGFNPDACKVNGAELISKIEKEKSFADAVNKYKPVDIANYAMEKYKTYENSVSFCYGLAKTIVNQEIRSAQIKIGNTYFEENVSKSDMVGVGKRMLQDGIGGNTNVYNENSAKQVMIDGDTVATEFSSKVETLNADDYKKAWGRNLSDMFIYCVHEITVLEGKTEVDGDGYKVTLSLNPDMGGYNYRYQMVTISGLDALPVFDYINLTFKLDSNLDLVHLNVDEKYTAKKVVNAEINNTLDYDFLPNQKWAIPSVDENINYEQLRGLVK